MIKKIYEDYYNRRTTSKKILNSKSNLNEANLSLLLQANVDVKINSGYGGRWGRITMNYGPQRL